jgi:hypothetical protein
MNSKGELSTRHASIMCNILDAKAPQCMKFASPLVHNKNLTPMGSYKHEYYRYHFIYVSFLMQLVQLAMLKFMDRFYSMSSHQI